LRLMQQSTCYNSICGKVWFISTVSSYLIEINASVVLLM